MGGSFHLFLAALKQSARAVTPTGGARAKTRVLGGRPPLHAHGRSWRRRRRRGPRQRTSKRGRRKRKRRSEIPTYCVLQVSKGSQEGIMLPSTRNALTGKIITWRHMESTRYIQEEEEEGGGGGGGGEGGGRDGGVECPTASGGAHGKHTTLEGAPRPNAQATAKPSRPDGLATDCKVASDQRPCTSTLVKESPRGQVSRAVVGLRIELAACLNCTLP